MATTVNKDQRDGRGAGASRCTQPAGVDRIYFTHKPFSRTKAFCPPIMIATVNVKIKRATSPQSDTRNVFCRLTSSRSYSSAQPTANPLRLFRRAVLRCSKLVGGGEFMALDFVDPVFSIDFFRATISRHLV